MIALFAALTACGQGVEQDDVGASEPDSPPSVEEVDEHAEPPSGSRLAYDNPVIADDFPDPDVLEVDGTFYAYATNGNLRNVRVARSTDLQDWELLDDALPDLPSWVIPGKTWAPEVTELADGSYVLYFTATNFDPTFQCIGVAVSDNPEGPFDVVGDEMLICPAEEGGAIDAATFLDEDGTRYLLWKNDGNCCGYDTWIYLAPLTPDGLALTDEPVPLIRQDQPWEGDLVEAPTLVKRDGTYVLFYSANAYAGDDYAIGYATASAADGPYTKAEEPLLTTEATDSEFIGPGGQDIVELSDGVDVLAFHSWHGDGTYRVLNILPLEWENGQPRITLQ